MPTVEQRTFTHGFSAARCLASRAMKYANILAFVGVAALLSGCGGDDGADDNDTQSNANQPGGGGNDGCTGTVTGGPHAGPLHCVISLFYSAPASVVSNTADVTTLTVTGGLDDKSGGITQNLVIRGRPMVQSYPELVNEPMMGLVRLGSVGTLDFADGSSSLFYGVTGSVTLTAVEQPPSGGYRISGSATWDVASSEYADTEASATIAITFRDQP